LLVARLYRGAGIAATGGAGYAAAMSRPTLATIAGLLFMLVFVVTAITLPDLVPRLHWTLEAIYWCVMGIVWVFPIRWLMFWSVYKR